MIKINQIKLPISHSEDDLVHKIESLLKLNKSKDEKKDIFTYEIIRKSIDARKKPDIYYIYSVLVNLKTRNEEKVVRFVYDNNIMLISEAKYHFFSNLKKREACINAASSKPPVVIGSGPAGLFCAYLLAEAGYHPIIVEQGESVEQRKESVEDFWSGKKKLKPDSNVQFGEGGAGTFSDGKLNTLVKDPLGRNRFVLETFVRFGAKQSILYDSKPHLGTDELIHIVKNMREYICKMGGRFLFSTKMTGLIIEDERIKGITINQHPDVILTNMLVLAIGHSARDTFYMLLEKKIKMEAKSFAVGIRMEHLQSQINEGQYGVRAAKEMEQAKKEGIDCILPAAEYKLTYQASNGRSVYSFCMCPGGYVVNASSEEGRLAINGMSYSKRDGVNANSALIVSVTPDDFVNREPLSGVEFQRRLEEKAYQIGNGNIPIQLYGDYRESCIDFNKNIKEKQCNQQASIEKEIAPCMKGTFQYADVKEIFPKDINEALIEAIEKFGGTIRGFNRPDAIISGVESRTSSPVRIVRDESGQSNIKGIYPCGEGAGYAGGISSAAMDGLRVAEWIIGG